MHFHLVRQVLGLIHRVKAHFGEHIASLMGEETPLASEETGPFEYKAQRQACPDSASAVKDSLCNFLAALNKDNRRTVMAWQFIMKQYNIIPPQPRNIAGTYQFVQHTPHIRTCTYHAHHHQLTLIFDVKKECDAKIHKKGQSSAISKECIPNSKGIHELKFSAEKQPNPAQAVELSWYIETIQMSCQGVICLWKKGMLQVEQKRL
eukprot:m.110065 g.110065  ORF g.110065 m.110065 type:complete len:206 (+) comp13385_c0_seq2:1163-1780(+)